jgi:hypothetical protein
MMMMMIRCVHLHWLTKYGDTSWTAIELLC